MRGLASLLGLTASLLLAGPAAAADQKITFTFPAYSPPDVTIKTGDTATFSGSFSSHPLVWDASQFDETNTGSSKSFSFSVPGMYAYHCRLHQADGMVGLVRVVADQHPARVAFAISPTLPTAGQPVTFTYTGDPDPDGTLTRWDWDLDGDGSFETSTASPAASTTYAAAGNLTVRMRAIDDSNEASAVAEQAVSIAPAGAAAPGSAASTADLTAPRVTRVSLKGLTLTFRATEPAAASAILRVRGKTVAKGTAKAGHTTVHLRLTAKGRTLLRRGKRVKATLELTLRDASANVRTIKRKVTVKRR
jgi:plastocyanin